MLAREWMFLALAATCCAVSYANLSCVLHCNVGADLNCTVQAIDIDCLSTAFSSSNKWPGKPERLDIQSYPVKNLDSHGLVGVNISWRTPSDASAAYVKGFEVSLNLLGSHVAGIKACYVFKLTRKTKSRVILQELVESIFTLQCQVPARTEGIFTQLYSLPKPQKRPLQKRVYKYIRLEVMPTTAAQNPCEVDPRITTNVDQLQAQIIVKLGKWLGVNKYSVWLMKGSYQFDQQTIQPGNGSGIQYATFGNPRNYQQGECYSIWVKMVSCENYWASSLTEKLCVSETPPPNTPPGPELGTPFSSTIRRTTLEEPPVPTSTIPIVTIVVLLILCLIGVAVFKYIQCGPHSFPWTRYISADPNPVIPFHRPKPQYRHEPEGKKRKLVFFYCLSLENKKCVQEFEKFLKQACGKDRCIEFIDFVNQDEIDKNSFGWITALVNMIGENGCHLVVIYSSGLTHLFEAEKKGKYYPGYINHEKNAEHLVSFFKRITDDLSYYSSHKVKEHVISLGSKYTENSKIVYRSLASFNGLRLKLLSDESGRVSVNMPDMCFFLKGLGIEEPMEVIESIDTGPLEEAVKNMLRVEEDPMWFEIKYGPPQERRRPSEDPSEGREQHPSNSDDSESDKYPQELSSSGFGTDGETFNFSSSQPNDPQGPNLSGRQPSNNNASNYFLSSDNPKPIPPVGWEPVPPKFW